MSTVIPGDGLYHHNKGSQVQILQKGHDQAKATIRFSGKTHWSPIFVFLMKRAGRLPVDANVGSRKSGKGIPNLVMICGVPRGVGMW